MNALNITNRWLILVSGTLFVTLLLWLADTPESTALDTTETPTDPVVTVLTATPQLAQTHITAAGITRARWLTDITSAVEGRVVSIAEDIQTGSLIQQGQPLVTQRNTHYQAELDATEARLAEAELHLDTVRNQQYVARKVDQAKTAFGRFEPHVVAAEANLKAARSAYDVARQRLADTVITAPYASIVIQEFVAPGTWLNAGDVVFRVAASDVLDIEVELPLSDWQRLDGVAQRTESVKVLAPDGTEWPARIRHLSPIMDPNTRQRSLVLEVAQPYRKVRPLLPNQHVTVVFDNVHIPHAVRAPASVLTDDGKVWSVIDNKLVVEPITLLDEQPEHVVFRYNRTPSESRYLVRFPLGTMLAGQAVTVQHN